MFQFTRFPSQALFYSGKDDGAFTPAGFLHSDIFGSKLLCSSPKRFAAYASFIGNLSLGIHHAASVAFLNR